MEHNNLDMISVDEILADALIECADEGYRKRTKGWYVAQVKHSLQELEFDTHFNVRFTDEVIPSTLRLSTPDGAFSISGVWVYNGENFSGDAQRVYHKFGMNSNGGGDGYAANNVQGMVDSLVDNSPEGSVDYFYGSQNGVIILSPACASYQKVRIVYKGFTKSIMGLPIIPPMIRESVLGFVVVKFYKGEMATDRSAAPLYDRHFRELYYPRGNSVWDNAKYRLTRLSPDMIRTLQLYWGVPPGQ